MKTLQVVASIIQKFTNIPQANIWVYSQRRNIPADKGLYIVVGWLGSKPYGNNSRHNGDSSTGAVFTQEQISITLLSYSTEAVTQVPNVLAALRSEYSQYRQQLDGYKIASIPLSVVDASEVDGAAILYRTVITVNIMGAIELSSEATFFDPDTVLFNVDYTEA
jgi:hypothetical protein